MGPETQKSRRLVSLFLFALFFILFLYNLPSEESLRTWPQLALDGLFLGLALFFLAGWMRAIARGREPETVRYRDRT